jgi:hypothetical protein
MATENQTLSKAAQTSAFNHVLADVSRQIGVLVKSRKEPVAELRKVTKEIVEKLTQAREMYKAKGQRRPSVQKSGVGNKGLCQPLLVNKDLQNFFITAKDMGVVRPFNYEVSRDANDLGKKEYEFKVNGLVGKDSIGQGSALPKSATNPELGTVLKSLRAHSITSSAQLNSLFSIYMRLHNLKTGGKHHVDAHMEKCLGAALDYLESLPGKVDKKGETRKFSRKSFDHCSLMKIISFYSKKDVTGLPAPRVAALAAERGMTVPQFMKSNAYSAEEIKTFLGPDGKFKEEFVKAVEAETEAVSTATALHRHHNTVVREKKPRVVKVKAAKVVAPVVDDATDEPAAPKKPAAPRKPAAPKAAVAPAETSAEPVPPKKPAAPRKAAAPKVVEQTVVEPPASAKVAAKKPVVKK